MNWQERIRQAEEIKRVQESIKGRREEAVKLAEARLREEARLKRETESQANRERARIEALPILERLRARQLFEGLREDVWKIGEVQVGYDFVTDCVQEERGPQAWCILSSKYPFATEKDKLIFSSPPRGGSDGSSLYRFDGYGIAYQKTYLKVRIFYNSSKFSWTPIGYCFMVYDNDAALSPLPGADKFKDVRSFQAISVDDSRAQAILEELALRSYLERERHGRLPLQLKTRGEEEIRRLVPWHRRLFR